MVQWADFPIGNRMWQNGDETLARTSMVMAENVQPNDAGSWSRFPGLTTFASFPADKVYLRSFRDQLYAGTDLGRLFRVAESGAVEDVTGTPVSGGLRWTFAETDDALLMAAGGPIIKLGGTRTDILSTSAPNTTHVAYLDGYVIALERASNRFQHSSPTDNAVWDAQDIFSANAVGENANLLVVTPYREMMIGGPKHIEQWETLANGDRAFSRRFSTGQGCAYPYTLVTDATGTYGVNEKKEFVRFAGQISQQQGHDIGFLLSMIDDWGDAWGGEMSMFGNKLMALVMPKATNPYGTKGVALCFDYGERKFSMLYGRVIDGAPTAWPVTSIARCYDKVFAGVPGGVAIFDANEPRILGSEFSALIRTPHVDVFGPSRFDGIRMRLRRGVDSPSALQASKLGVRVNRDNLGFDKWQWVDMGVGARTMIAELGPQGAANTWQFEFRLTDGLPLEIVDMKAWVERLSW